MALEPGASCAGAFVPIAKEIAMVKRLLRLSRVASSVGCLVASGALGCAGEGKIDGTNSAAILAFNIPRAESPPTVDGTLSEYADALKLDFSLPSGGNSIS